MFDDRKVIWFLFLVLFFPNPALAIEKSELSNLIQNLGLKPGYETDISSQAKDFYILDKNKGIALPYLVNELKPINEHIIYPEGEKGNAEALHIIWCVRALRFLTECTFFTEKERGDRFDAKDQIRIMLLMQKIDNEYSFFATSDTREKIYIAPM